MSQAGYFSSSQTLQSIYSTFTTGSVVFQGPNGLVVQNNANLFWDNTNIRLGIGTNTPSVPLQVNGSVAIGGVDTGTPSLFTLRGPQASGTDVPGADWRFDASNGTGSGGSGNLIFRTAPPVVAAPAYNSSSLQVTSSVNTFTFAFTAATGSNNLLVVEYVMANGNAVNSATYGGVALTQLSAINSPGGSDRIEIWYLVGPASGSNNLVSNFDNNGNYIIDAISITGANQSTPFNTVSKTSGTGTPVSLSPVSAVGQLVIDLVSFNNNPATVSGGQTAIWNTTNTGGIYGAGSYKAATAGTTTVSYTDGGSGNNYAMIAVAIQAPGGTTSDTLVEVMRMTPSGNVGVNTASPAYQLTVNGTAAANNVLIQGNTSGYILQTAAATTASYFIQWPAAQGATNTTLVNNGSGTLSWSVPQITALEASATTNATTTSGTDALLTGMTITPTPGTYLYWFSAAINSNQAGATITLSAYLNGTQIAQSVRAVSQFDGGTASASNASGGVAINGLVTVTTGALAIQWHTTAGTATAGPRTLNMIRVA